MGKWDGFAVVVVVIEVVLVVLLCPGLTATAATMAAATAYILVSK